MEVGKFNEFIQESRTEFRKFLEDWDGEYQKKLKDLLKRMIAKCCSDFEEETLKENLQQEFSEFMKCSK